MSATTHDYTVPPAPDGWTALNNPPWNQIAALSPFVLTDNSRQAIYQTTTSLCYDNQALYIHFHCEDPDIWGTMTKRDEPIYNEEVVEIFLAPGIENPTHYYEFEISPDGVLFDAKIVNPGPDRGPIEVITEWDCPGIHWQTRRQDSDSQWSADVIIPWESIAPTDSRPHIWRANFTRIECPRKAEPEFSCWSPTLTNPANFHKPTEFGVLRFT